MASPSNININHRLINNFNDLPERALNFLYANVCSILKEGRLEQLKDFLKTHDVDVMILTETWLRTCDEVKRADIEGYRHFYNTRNGIDRGGVSIYVKPKLRPSLTYSKFEGGVNFLWVRLNLNTELEIGGIYNPGGETNATQFLNEYSSQLKQMQHAIVFGDFNIDLLKLESKTRNYKNKLDEAGYVLLNKVDVGYSTRETDNSSTIIDHVSTNLNTYKNQFQLTVCKTKTLSDHNILHLGVTKVTPSGDQETGHKRPRNSNNTQDTSEHRIARTEETIGESRDSRTGETSGTTNGAAEVTKIRKRQPAEKEFMCQYCSNLYVYPMNYIKHLKKIHGYTGRITEHSIVRRCPNCGVPCRRKAYNRHVRKCTEFRHKSDSSKDWVGDRRSEADSDEQDSSNDDDNDDDGSESSDGSGDSSSGRDDTDDSSSDEDSSGDDDDDSSRDDAKMKAFNRLKQLCFLLQSGKLSNE